MIEAQRCKMEETAPENGIRFKPALSRVEGVRFEAGMEVGRYEEGNYHPVLNCSYLTILLLCGLLTINFV